ncbi:MAG: anion permease [Candidatus Bathyarchaeota archaeon]|nr:anion permease [Candidatus Bathyarchaeota archaeon]
MLFTVVLAALTFAAVALVAGNNLSACVGPAVGSRILSKQFGALLGAVGFSAGLLVQGSFMTRAVGVLLPDASSVLRSEALLVAIVVFIIAHVIRVPMSLNMSLVGMLAGLSVAKYGVANSGYLFEVAVIWFAAPLIALVIAFWLIRFLNRGWPTNFWRRLQTYKLLLIVLSFSSAYVLGANTLGLIVATGGFDAASVLVAVAAIFVGSFLLGRGAIRRISEEFFLMRYANATATLVTSTFLVEIATVFNIPLSNTQTTTAAMFGTGLSYKKKYVSLKPFLTIVVSWVATPILSFAIGLALGRL